MSNTTTHETNRATSDTGDDGDQPTVLVVDDEPNVAQAYALWLGDGYDARTAEDGEEALAQIDDDVDVVLLDRRMPGMSGDEVLSEIRKRGYDVRVAMVTAVDPDFDILEMPFDAYLTKPVERSDLVDVVEELLAQGRFDEDVRKYFELAEKRAALETEKTTRELEESERYQRLVEEQESLPDPAEQLGEMDHETFSKVVTDFDSAGDEDA